VACLRHRSCGTQNYPEEHWDEDKVRSIYRCFGDVMEIDWRCIPGWTRSVLHAFRDRPFPTVLVSTRAPRSSTRTLCGSPTSLRRRRLCGRPAKLIAPICWLTTTTSRHMNRTLFTP
jgi:hypothetical protein